MPAWSSASRSLAPLTPPDAIHRRSGKELFNCTYKSRFVPLKVPSFEISVQSTSWSPCCCIRATIDSGGSDAVSSQPPKAIWPSFKSNPRMDCWGYSCTKRNQSASFCIAIELHMTLDRPASKRLLASSKRRMPPPVWTESPNWWIISWICTRFTNSPCFAPFKSTTWMWVKPASAKALAWLKGWSLYTVAWS